MRRREERANAWEGWAARLIGDSRIYADGERIPEQRLLFNCKLDARTHTRSHKEGLREFAWSSVRPGGNVCRAIIILARLDADVG